jgi:prophage regulatory protein
MLVSPETWSDTMSKLDRLLCDREVRRITGTSRTTRWRLIRKKQFPEPVQITPHRIGWRESDIIDWLETRPVGFTGSVKK